MSKKYFHFTASRWKETPHSWLDLFVFEQNPSPDSDIAHDGGAHTPAKLK